MNYARTRARHRRRHVLLSAFSMVLAAAAVVTIVAVLTSCSLLNGGNASAPMAPAPSTSQAAPASSAPMSSAPMSSAPMSSAPMTTAPPTHSVPMPTTPRPTVHAPGTGRCTAADLTVSLGASSAAAGSQYQQIEFRNRSMAPCTLAGYPGAALTSGTSPADQLGDAAGRNPVTPHTVTLAPGQYASSLLRIGDPANYPAAQGHIVNSSYLQVYIPDVMGAVYLPDKVACTTVKSVPALQVSPVTADESGPA